MTVAPEANGENVRVANEVFIHMHRNFRASRNLRAQWFFDHLNKSVRIEDATTDDVYDKEMTVVGIVPRSGGSTNLGKIDFRVTPDTTITFLSRYYRHVFILDLSPSAFVADEEGNCCLYTELLNKLRLSLISLTKKFALPGTTKIFSPQIYLTVCVFTPFLGFEHDLVLVHGVLLTESNVCVVLEQVEKAFYALVSSLYTYSRPILSGWGKLRKRRHRQKFESTCDQDMQSTETLSTIGLESPRKQVTKPKPKVIYPNGNIMSTGQGVWTVSVESDESSQVNNGYIRPEWALIFMLRTGLMAVRMLPENTQSNIVVITDGVCGIPDATALQDLITKMRSHTVSCSFIQLQNQIGFEPCFGHVPSCELLHFISMSTFGAYFPSVANDVVESGNVLNDFHRELLGWSFQSSVNEETHITKLISNINPDFALLYKEDIARSQLLSLEYSSTLHEMLYVRLREGFGLKRVMMSRNGKTITVMLSLPYRPLIFVYYSFTASWPPAKQQRERISVEIEIEAPRLQLSSIIAESHSLFTQLYRQQPGVSPCSIVAGILESDRLLRHINSFNEDKAYYVVPSGITQNFPMFLATDKRSHNNNSCRFSNKQKATSFAEFWQIFCHLNDELWQKWVHMHTERVVLRSEARPKLIFQPNRRIEINCAAALDQVREMIRKNTSFCLVKDTCFVTFIYDDKSAVPKHFYLVRLCMEPPCVSIKLAFLASIVSGERRKIAGELRRRLLELKAIQSDGSERDTLRVIRRPLEMILVRYDEVPSNLQQVVRIRFDENADDEELEPIIVHNTISKYLVCRRRVWSMSSVTSMSMEQRYSLAMFVMNVLFHRRLIEGFVLTGTKRGIVATCRQVIVQSGPSLEQYIIFPPTLVSGNSLHVVQSSARRSDDRLQSKLVMLAEFWKEPCANLQSNVLQGPSEESEDELVCCVFTMDQILRLRSDNEFATLGNGDRAVTKKSECVFFVEKPFDLLTLLNNSAHHLVLLPTFDADVQSRAVQNSVLLSSVHREFALFADHFFEPSNDFFWHTIATSSSKFCDVYNKCTDGIGKRCRVYLKKVSEWTAVVFVLPVAWSPVEECGFIPVHVFVCDECLLCTQLINHRSKPKSQLIDRTSSRNYTEPVVDDDVFVDPDWISTLRKTDGTMAYERVSLDSCVTNLMTLFERSRVTTLFVLCKQGVCLKPDATIEILENQCDYVRLEIESVTSALDTFCSHMNPKGNSQAECCKESSLDALFTDVIKQHFMPVPGAPHYFYYVNRRLDSHRTSEDASTTPSVIVRRDSHLIVDTKSADQSADESNPILPKVSVGSRTTETTLRAKRYRRNHKKSKESEIPLFLLFNCTVAYPDQRIDHFSLTSLPSCVKQIVQLATLKPTEDMDLWRTRVTVDMYVMTLSSLEERADDEDDNIMQDIAARNEAKLIKLLPQQQERNVVKQLVQSLNRLVELETVLIDSRRKEISLERIRSVSKFISKELSLSVPGNGRWEERSRALQLVIESPTSLQKLLERLNGVVLRSEYNNDVRHFVLQRVEESDMFYVVQIENHEEEEMGMSTRKSSSSSMSLNTNCSSSEMEADELSDGGGSDDTSCTSATLGRNAELLSRARAMRASADCHIAMERARTNSKLSRTFSHDCNMLLDTATPLSQSVPPASASCATLREPDICVDEDVSVQPTVEQQGNRDFWIILTVGDMLQLQLCQRFCANMDSRYNQLWDKTWLEVRKVLRTVNQELLLKRLYETRECDELLMTKEVVSLPTPMGSCFNLTRNATVPSSPLLSEDEDEEMVDDVVANISRFAYGPGYFSCKVKLIKWFEVHSRLTRSRVRSGHGPYRSVFESIRVAFEPFIVRNRPNTYVLRETNGAIFYLQLHTETESIKKSMRNNSNDTRRQYISRMEQKVTQNGGGKSIIAAVVHGVCKPGEEVNLLLKEKLKKRLDQAVLDQLLDAFGKNPQTRLDPNDVTFIQRDVTRPQALWDFAIPSAFGSLLAAVEYYIQQHMQDSPHFSIVRYVDQTGADGHLSGQFVSYCDSVDDKSQKQPAMYYLHIKLPTPGRRTTGIAVVEIRIVDGYGKPCQLTEGRLNQTTAGLLLPHANGSSCEKTKFFQSLLNVTCGEDTVHTRNACAYAQAAVWQSGDVGLEELRELMRQVVVQALCDAVTEYGVLNLPLIERDSSHPPPMPLSPNPYPSPASKQTPKSATSTASAAERRQMQMRKRDSFEAHTPAQPLPQNHTMFSFDRRGSNASEVGHVSFQSDSLESQTRTELLNSRFVSTAPEWFDCMAQLLGDHRSSYFSRQSWTFDSRYTLRVALGELCRRVQMYVNQKTPTIDKNKDELFVCESTAPDRFEVTKIVRKFGCWSSVHEHQLLEDVGVLEEDNEKIDMILLGYAPSVALHTLRFGFEPGVEMSPLLEKLVDNDGRDLRFMPCLKPFVPRQRLFLGVIRGNHLRVTFYNFYSEFAREIRRDITKVTSWYNAKARLLREIGLHKCGITHLSPLAHTEENSYLKLVWRHPEVLLDNVFPPDVLGAPEFEKMKKGYSDSLFRLYRRTPHHGLFVIFTQRPDCLVQGQFQQMRGLRLGVWDRLNCQRLFSQIHSNLQNKQREISRGEIESLMRASRLVHFVESPVLLFPSWRRVIAEVRKYAEDSDSMRKVSTPSNASSPQVSGGSQQKESRPRANTLSPSPWSFPNVPPGATSSSSQSIRFHSEDDDPVQVVVLKRLVHDYMKYLRVLGFEEFIMPPPSDADKGVKESVKSLREVMFKVTKGGIILAILSFKKPYFKLSMHLWNVEAGEKTGRTVNEKLALEHARELERLKDDLVTSCHLHSFTYDFHLRLLSKYLMGAADECLFAAGYNTHSFLTAFLEYYHCRPPNARNCVYEDTQAFALRYNVTSEQLWSHFLKTEKHFAWKVVKIKQKTDLGDDYMLVSSEMGSNGNDTRDDTYRIVIRDPKKADRKDQLNLIVYLIMVAGPTAPLEDERHREESRQSDVGEFLSFGREKEDDTERQRKIDEMENLVSTGLFPTLDGAMPSRRRFSSGGHLKSTPANAVAIVRNSTNDAESVISRSPSRIEGSLMKNAESDGDIGSNRLAIHSNIPQRRHRKMNCEEGDIPMEKVTYIHFLSPRQRKLQQALEDAVNRYMTTLKHNVDEAEKQCRKDIMWKNLLLQMPKKTAPQSTLSIFLPSNPNRHQDPWTSLRQIAQENAKELDTLVKLVTCEAMEGREPRLAQMLQGSNCARLCRFLYARFTATRCRFFEMADKMCLAITNPDGIEESAFLVTCTSELTPKMFLLFKDGPPANGGEEKGIFRLKRLDVNFDEIVGCVTAFLWSDLLQKPPGTNS